LKRFGTGVRISPPPSAFAKASADRSTIAKATENLSAEDLHKAVPAIAFSEGGLLYYSIHGRKMSTVYLIRSISHPQQTYIGVTSDLEHRLKDHNARQSPHTSKYAPWKLVAAIRFNNIQKANAFERYLKTGSGRAFAKRHFW
jgi:putative endonuclease